MKTSLFVYWKKIWGVYLSVVSRVHADLKEDTLKTLISFLLFLLIYFLFDDPLTSAVVVLGIAALFFRCSGKIFLHVGFFFLAGALFFLLIRDPYWGNAMIRYAYGVVGIGLAVMCIRYGMRAAREKTSEENFARPGHPLFSPPVLIALLSILFTIVGFYMLFHMMSAKIRIQQGMIDRLAGFDMTGEDPELTALKEQLMEAVALVSLSTKEYPSSTISSPSSEDMDAEEILPQDITMDILNGTQVAGAASALKNDLSKKGYGVLSIGNEPSKEYVETVVQYRDSTEKAQKIKAELDSIFFVIIEQNANIPHDIRIIIGERKES